MPDRSFESQQWAANLEAQAMDRKIQSSAQLGQQVSAGIESFNQQANTRRGREQQDSQFSRGLEDKQAGRQQQQSQFETREQRFEEEQAERAEMDTKKFALDKIRTQQAQRQIQNMEARMQMQMRELDHKVQVNEKLALIEERDFDMDLMERQQAYAQRNEQSRRDRIEYEASMVAGGSDEDVTQWLQKDSVQRLLQGGDQVGPPTPGAGNETGMKAIASARQKQAMGMIGMLLKGMDRDDPDRYEVTALGMDLANGEITPEQATDKIRAIYRAGEANGMDANPTDPATIERAISSMSPEEKGVYDRFGSVPFGPGSQIKIAKWLARPDVQSDLMAIMVEGGVQGREFAIDDANAVNHMVEWVTGNMSAQSRYYEPIIETLFGPAGPLSRELDWEEHNRMRMTAAARQMGGGERNGAPTLMDRQMQGLQRGGWGR